MPSSGSDWISNERIAHGRVPPVTPKGMCVGIFRGSMTSCCPLVRRLLVSNTNTGRDVRHDDLTDETCERNDSSCL
jgi:hypothetical protein